MRIETLRITGFGPFRDTQVIDFKQFSNDLFLITGKTGAGKSSILDAICFAFFGDIPRFDKTDSAFRSDYCDPLDPSEVVLEFSLGDEHYRIARSPEYERPARRGGGMTTQKSTATLERLDGTAYRAETTALRETNLAIGQLLHLNKAQFLQVILLAQGQFQHFLRASSEDRLPVLRSLFETTRFEKLEKRLDDKRKDLEAILAAAQTVSARLRQDARSILSVEEDELAEQDLAAWFREQLGNLEARVAEKRRDSEQAELAREESASELDRLREVERRQREQTGALKKLGTLKAAEASIATDVSRLALDARALAALPQIDAHSTAVQAWRESENAFVAACRSEHLGSPQPTDAGAAKLMATATDRLIGSLESAIVEENELPTLESRLATADTDLQAAISDVAKVTARRSALPSLIASENDELQRLAASSAVMASIEGAIERLKLALIASRRAEAAQLELDKQVEALLVVSRDDAVASAHHQDLLSRLLSGYAGVLAGGLEDNEPCPVCGSLTHPEVAKPDASAVSQDDVDSARARMTATRASLDSATSRKSEIAADLAAAEASAGGKTADALDRELGDASLRLSVAVQASITAETRRSVLHNLESELADSMKESERLNARRESARALRDGLASRTAELGGRVLKSREDFASVSARVSAAKKASVALRAFQSAFEELERARATMSQAAVLVEDAVRRGGFETQEEVLAARLTDSARLQAQERVESHKSAMDSVGGILASLGDVSTENVDLDAALGISTATSAIRDSARDLLRGAVEARESFAKLIAQAGEDALKSADLRKEFDEVRELAAAVAGKAPNTKLMRLETYVLAAELEDIVAAANQRLAIMTSGRFVLQHDDKIEYGKVRSGLGLEVLDQYSGRVRATHSLSGGETFLASLALALGLAEVVSSRSGAVRLDTLFVDEGFGSLDGDTLELAMSTLDGLRAGGRTIGIISHVDAMKEQVHSQLHVEVTDRGDSRVRN